MASTKSFFSRKRQARPGQAHNLATRPRVVFAAISILSVTTSPLVFVGACRHRPDRAAIRPASATNAQRPQEASPSRRSSAERPAPWTEERRPFDTGDRMGIDVHQALKNQAETKTTAPKQPTSSDPVDPEPKKKTKPAAN